MSKPFKKQKIDKIAAIDAMGFILGSAMALELKTGFVPIRKEERLPGMKKISTSFIDFSKKKKALEINQASIKKNEKILIVDDWMETGSQIRAAIKLIQKQKGKVIGISLFAAEKKEETKELFDKYKIKAVGVFEGEELERIKKQIKRY